MKWISSLALAGCGLAATLLQGQSLEGRPCLFNDYIPEWRCFPAILRDLSGNLTCGKFRLNNGGVTAAPAAAGPVCATACRFLAGAGPELHFAFRDAEGGIQDLRSRRQGEKEHWLAQKVNGGGQTQAAPAAGNPSGCFLGGVYTLVYRDADGGVVELAYDGAWHAGRLNLAGGTSAPAAAGDPVQMQLQGRRHVVYRDGDGGLQDLWFDQGWKARRLNLGGLTPGPGAAGEPAGLDHLKGSHVFYRDRDGRVQDLFYDQGWKVQCLNLGGRTAAPAAQGDPCAATVAGLGLQVLYRDRVGGLQSLTCGSAWQARVLNNGGETDAPPAGSEPVQLAPPSHWEYVAYVDIHGAGKLLARYPGKGWVAVPLNADTPPGAPLEAWKGRAERAGDRDQPQEP